MLFIVADQFPESFFQRFEHLLNGGLATLRKKGVVFTDAKYAHALTNTCPGHASLVTGSNPKTHGVINNLWFDRELKQYRYCAHDDYGVAGPTNLRVSTLPDWLQKQHRGAKVFSISAKDRSAVILGGESADAALWYDAREGKFVSSSYYDKGQKWWLKNFNNSHFSNSLFGSLWEALPVSEEDLKKAQIVQLDEGVFPRHFPHAIGLPSILPNVNFYKALGETPFIDDFTTALVKQLVLAERLGQDNVPDYLAISYSALDYVGHEYGPNSREVVDTVLRLDRSLQSLFTFLDQQIGLENILIAFSSDHGVQPLPEYKLSRGESAYRIAAKDIACVQQIAGQVSKNSSPEDLFLANYYLNQDYIRKFGLSRKTLDAQFTQAASRCSLVKRVWSSEQLHPPSAEALKFGRQYVLNYDEERSPDYFLQLKPYNWPGVGHGTGHGSAYRYDSHVPMIILHPELAPQVVSGPAQPIDLAVSIADLLGLETPDSVEGKSWLEIILR